MTSSIDRLVLSSRYPSTDAGIQSALHDFDALSRSQSWGEAVSSRLRLAVEELMYNTVRHGGQPSDTGWFAIRILESVRTLRVTIEDHGKCFDPTLHPAPDASLPLEARAPGGSGIALVRAMTNQFHYERAGSVNRVTVALHRDHA